MQEKLDDLWHSFFDHNYYEVLTVHGWEETHVLSIDITREISIEVINPDHEKWLSSNKHAVQPPLSVKLHGIDVIRRCLRYSTQVDDSSS